MVDICIIIQVAYLTIRASADRNEVESRMRGKSRCTDRDKQGGRRRKITKLDALRQNFRSARHSILSAHHGSLPGMRPNRYRNKSKD